jgi:hypothetical protein
MQKPTEPPETPRVLKPTVVLALDPGLTTGIALVRVSDRKVVGTTTADAEDLGEKLDQTVRSIHRDGYRVLAVVEQEPHGRTYQGDDLDVVRRTIAHWLQGVFGLVPTFIEPGQWKPSRVARAAKFPALRSTSTGRPYRMSTHERDAVRMALYHIDREGLA